jgi:putative transposase
MQNIPQYHHRRSVRLPGYDYGQAGGYFVTICAHQRACLFGDIVDGETHLSAFGQVVAEIWEGMPEHHPHVELDAFVVMPNHVHGILHILRRGTACRAPTYTTARFAEPVPGSLPTIIRSFKSAVTKRINEIRGTSGQPVWQRNYYEHVIRTQDDLDDIRQYILGNPAKWSEDHDNPQNYRPHGINTA